MGFLLQCRQMLTVSKSFCHSNSDAIRRSVRRAYHQYKPKDRPTIQETTQTLDPHITRDVLLFRYEEPLKVYILIKSKVLRNVAHINL